MFRRRLPKQLPYIEVPLHTVMKVQAVTCPAASLVLAAVLAAVLRSEDGFLYSLTFIRLALGSGLPSSSCSPQEK